MQTASRVVARLKPQRPDIKKLLKKHGYWYQSGKIHCADDWLIFFCFGAFMFPDDVEVDWTLEGERAHNALRQWETWCCAPRERLAPAGRFITDPYHIRLRQWHTAEQHPVYLMEHLCAYLPDSLQTFWHLQEHGAVLVTDQDRQPVGVFAEFRPQVPIFPLEVSANK